MCRHGADSCEPPCGLSCERFCVVGTLAAANSEITGPGQPPGPIHPMARIRKGRTQDMGQPR